MLGISLRTCIRALVSGLLIFTVLVLLPFAWILRDGLGPDATSSEGMDAMARWFMTFYSGPVLLVLMALAWLAGRSEGLACAGEAEG